MLVYFLITFNFIITLLSLIFCFRLSGEYRSFNKNVKNWAEELDRTTNSAINRQALSILEELDNRITNLNNNKTNEDETHSQSEE